MIIIDNNNNYNNNDNNNNNNNKIKLIIPGHKNRRCQSDEPCKPINKFRGPGTSVQFPISIISTKYKSGKLDLEMEF